MLLLAGVGTLLLLLGLVVGGARWSRSRLLIVTVEGPSMLPTYDDGDRLLVRRLSGRQPRVGQVVLAEVPWSQIEIPSIPAPDLQPSAGPAQTVTPLVPPGAGGSVGEPLRVVKRVAAVAGEPAPVQAGQHEPVVPAGMVMLLGDNPSDSNDSREFGHVPAEAVVGVVVRRLSPRRAGRVESSVRREGGATVR